MKIRNGFVSNSSSSSFCIYGSQIDIVDIKKYFPEEVDTSLEDEYDLVEDMYDKGVEWWEISSKIEKDLGDGFSCFCDWESPAIYVGREPKTLTDAETGFEFKMLTEQRIQEIISPDYQCSWIEETIQS